MSESLNIRAIPSMPRIEIGDDIGRIIAETSEQAGIQFEEDDILCVASKAVSEAEGRKVNLGEVAASEKANELHGLVPRKDPRVIELMLEATHAADGSRLEINGNHIAGWLPNGLRLTSAGIDKVDAENVILLPEDPDESAKRIGHTILDSTGMNVGVIITDSDGRPDKKGATQIAIGTYGVPPLRVSDGGAEETLCDMLSASAALLMGQRGTGVPAVLIRGMHYDFDPNATIAIALNPLPKKQA